MKKNSEDFIRTKCDSCGKNIIVKKSTLFSCDVCGHLGYSKKCSKCGNEKTENFFVDVGDVFCCPYCKKILYRK